MYLGKIKFFKVLLVLLAIASPSFSQIPETWWADSNMEGWPKDYWVEEGEIFSVSTHYDKITLLGNAYQISDKTVFLSADLRRLTVEEFAQSLQDGRMDGRLVVWAAPADTGLPMAMKIQGALPNARSTQHFARLEKDPKGKVMLRTARPSRILIDEFGDAQGEPVVDFLGNVLQADKMPQPGDRVRLLLHEGTVVRIKRLGRAADSNWKVGLRDRPAFNLGRGAPLTLAQ